MSVRARASRLPPEVNRAIYVRNLPFNMTPEEMYELFGQYGAIRQIRAGVTKETRGSAYVVYEDIYDAKNACDHLSGFNVQNRYLIVLYHNVQRYAQRMNVKKQEEELRVLQRRFGVDGEQHAQQQQNKS